MALEQGRRHVAHEDGAGSRRPDEPLEYRPGLALAVEVELSGADALSDQEVADVDAELDGRGLGCAVPLALGGRPDRHRGVRSPARGIFDGLHAERRHESHRAQLLDSSAEALHLVDEQLERTTGIEPGVRLRRQHQGHAQHGHAPALPADRTASRGAPPRGRPRGPGAPRVRARWGRRRAGEASDRNPCLTIPYRTLSRETPRRAAAWVTFQRVSWRASSRWARSTLPTASERDMLASRCRGVVESTGCGTVRQPEHVRRRHRHLGEQGDALHHIGELADVAGPAVGEQRRPSVGRERLGRDFVVGAGAGEEALGEAQDVLSPIAERWQGESHDGEPVVEVFPEAVLERWPSPGPRCWP